MKIGIPKEIKNNENRVAVTPANVQSLIKEGHEVYIESGAGAGSGFFDEEYERAGAKIVTRNLIWEQEMVMKVKEPLPEEYQYFHEGLILFTYLHLAAEPTLTKALVDAKVTSVAYETVQEQDGSLPLLAPMSEIAGKIATQVGAQFLEKTKGGKGILLGGISGVERGKVTIIGGGVVGTNAAKIALGLGANVTILDVNPKRLIELNSLFGNQVNTLISNPINIAKSVVESDLVIGAVLIPGTKAPKLVSEDIVKEMKYKSVIIDVAIDQGGIFETIDRTTTHDFPTYEKHHVIHYAVPNMPGAVPRTASLGLTNFSMPYALKLANHGVVIACKIDHALRKGVNTMNGYVTYQAVADAHHMEYMDIHQLINYEAISRH